MKSLFEETGGTYTLQGDYYFPNLTLPAEENRPIGIWGQRHARYLKQHYKVRYYNLLTSGKLNGYLADIDKQAEAMFSRLLEQMAEHEGVTEQLKAENALEWTGCKNSVCFCMKSKFIVLLDFWKIECYYIYDRNSILSHSGEIELWQGAFLKEKKKILEKV